MEDLTTNMNNMTKLAQRDARVLLIIAVVTLIYLPATFVSVSSIDYYSFTCIH